MNLLSLFCILFCQLVLCQTTPKTYVAKFTDEPLEIDGFAKENAWLESEWTDSFIDIEGVEIPKFETKVKMLWDSTYFYIYSKLEEPHIWADLYQRDTIIFYNNDFEVFLDPDGDTKNYMEVEVNALNTVWDLLLPKAYRDQGSAVDSFDLKGMKSAVHITGTLNNPNDTDKFWEVELALPWKELIQNSLSKEIPVNDFWRVNFSRVNWEHELDENEKYRRKKDSKGDFLPEYNWVWSPQRVINMHEPEFWGYVFFSDSENNDFSIPKEEWVKYKLFEIHRNLIDYHKTYKRYPKKLEELKGIEYNVLDKEVQLNYIIKGKNYRVVLESPFSGKTYELSNEGIINVNEK